MSFYEKYTNSKFYHFTDFLLKIVILNVLMLLTTLLGLVVVGLPIALLSGIITIKAVIEKGSSGVFKIYIKVVKSVLKRSIKSIIMFSALLMILGFNLVFFYTGLEPFSWYYLFSFMIMLILFILTVIAYMHSLFLSSLYELSIKSLAKHSYLLSMGFIVRGILWIVVGFLLVYIMILIPLLGLVIGLSSLCLATYYLLITGYRRIDALDDLLEEFIENIVY